MSIKNVKVVDGCISCGVCEGLCPNIFKIEGTSKVISDDYEANKDCIKEAEASCPVQVIVVEEE